MAKKKKVKRKTKREPKPDFFQNAVRIAEQATGEKLAIRRKSNRP